MLIKLTAYRDSNLEKGSDEATKKTTFFSSKGGHRCNMNGAYFKLVKLLIALDTAC